MLLDDAECALYSWWVSSIPEQILAATKARGWTVAQLLRESGLDMSRSSLQRKLRGEVTLYETELRALVDTLQITVAVVPSDLPRRKKAS